MLRTRSASQPRGRGWRPQDHSWDSPGPILASRPTSRTQPEYPILHPAFSTLHLHSARLPACARTQPRPAARPGGANKLTGSQSGPSGTGSTSREAQLLPAREWIPANRGSGEQGQSQRGPWGSCELGQVQAVCGLQRSSLRRSCWERPPGHGGVSTEKSVGRETDVNLWKAAEN